MLATRLLRAVPFKSVGGEGGTEDFFRRGRGRILNYFTPLSPPEF